jgi:hypothetical protein
MGTGIQYRAQIKEPNMPSPYRQIRTTNLDPDTDEKLLRLVEAWSEHAGMRMTMSMVIRLSVGIAHDLLLEGKQPKVNLLS